MASKYVVAGLAAGGILGLTGIALYLVRHPPHPSIDIAIRPTVLPATGGPGTLTVITAGVPATVVGSLMENREVVATFLLNRRVEMVLDFPPNPTNMPMTYAMSVATSLITSGTVEVVVNAESYGVAAITLTPTPSTITGPGTVDIVASVTPSSGVTTEQLNAAGYAVVIFGGPGSVSASGAPSITTPAVLGTVAVDPNGLGTLTAALQAPVTGSTDYFFYAQGPSSA